MCIICSKTRSFETNYYSAVADGGFRLRMEVKESSKRPRTA